jgi:Fe-S-cluster-containing dehydrogenase component
MTKKIYIDPSKCTGCRTCELVCSIKNENMANPVLSRIQNVQYKYLGQRIPTLCLQCEDAICVSSCPTGALRRDGSLGVVKHSKDLCIGCGLCFISCPFGGIAIDPRSGGVFKCELCEGDPECVKACLDKAITYEEPDVTLLNKKMKSIESISILLEKYAVQSGAEDK